MPKIIDLIVQIYSADRTTINLGKLKETIKVTWHQTGLQYINPVVQDDHILYNTRVRREG